MAYVPDANDELQPGVDKPVESAAAEFRAIKKKVNQLAIGQISAGPGNSQFSHRNKIINGKMEISQRGTSFAAANNYNLDRWQFAAAGGGVVTITQSTDVPASLEFQNSLNINVTTVDTAIAAGDVTVLKQVVEGYNARDLIGRTFTISFWVRSAKVGVHCVSFRNSGVDRSYVLEYSVVAANTWEKKTLKVAGGLITAGTWNWTNGVGFYFDFTLIAGTDFQTAAGAWQVGSKVSTVNQVNVMDTVGNIFAVTGVQIEAGDVATPFEHRDVGDELRRCQRYYEVMGKGASGSLSMFGYVSAANLNVVSWNQFAVQKRAAPALAVVGTFGASNCGQPTPDSSTVYGFRKYVTSAAAGMVISETDDVNDHITASAEL